MYTGSTAYYTLFALLQDTLYEGSAGRIDQSPEAARYTPDTFTYVASLAKLLTATCLLQLVERGQITLEEDLGQRFQFVSEVKILQALDEDDKPTLEENHRPITLRYFLTHTSGLTYEKLLEPLIRWRQALRRGKADVLIWTEEDFSMPLLFEPGTQWLYGTGINWAGMLLEKATGQSLQKYMTTNIF
jgi:CubicO group peptidase (beta-lactamase class C family)